MVRCLGGRGRHAGDGRARLEGDFDGFGFDLLLVIELDDRFDFDVAADRLGDPFQGLPRF